ncbi:MAG: pilus assembly protein TadG-related protein [Gemmatimonadaceae bacterium]
MQNRSGVSRIGRPVSGLRKGAMLVFVAVTMVSLFGFLAMTLDVGAGNRQRRIAQTAADAGAIGGAHEILRLNYGLVVSGAQAEMTRNGCTPGGADSVLYPPATGPHTGDSKYVEVIINRTLPTIFGQIFSVANLNVRARAVAGVGSYSLTCLYSLDPTGAGAVEVTNGGNLATNCGVSVNSSHAKALEVNNSGQLDAGSAGIAVTGGWDGRKDPSPLPQTGLAAVTNPLNYLIPPVVGACTQTGLLNVTAIVTLIPGVYCGGIRVATSGRVTFQPGVYILKGGLTAASGGQVTGAGVTFYNTSDATYAFGPFDFGTGCKAKLSAPTVDPYKGILFYSDPNAPTGVTNTFACSSDDPPELTGIIYLQTQEFLFNGSNSGSQLDGAIVARKVTVGGKVTINNLTGGTSGLVRFTLVE